MTCVTPEERQSLAKWFRSRGIGLKVCPEFLCPDTLHSGFLPPPKQWCVPRSAAGFGFGECRVSLGGAGGWAEPTLRLLGLWTRAAPSATWAEVLTPAEQWGAHGKFISSAAAALFQRHEEPASQFPFSLCS